MAGLIKKQILKHLSKFAKNLSADSINLSTLKGEGELSNLELDCIAIQNLIDLPTWLQINHAKCNRVHVKIPWTKLKATAITLFLDCVDMEMATCEKPRPPNGPSPIEASASNGDSSYGFIEKVLEGITVRINSINVNFTSAVFKAEFQLSQLLVFSTDPEGKRADLRFTRIINNALGQVLTFKKITWQTMRVVIDAASLRTGTAVKTPIRLITNQVTVVIVLRRKMSNLAVLASKLHLKFDDLLWVLSDAQVQSALLCVKSIRETIERSRMQGRSRSDSLSRQNISPPVTPHYADAPSSASDPFFMRHMIHETSYHCDIDRLDLHICDDGTNPNTQAAYKKVVEGGAILITLTGLRMDHYPYHRAGKDRNYFRGYNEISASRDKWAKEIIEQFRKDFAELKKAATAASTPTSSSSTKLLEACMVFRLLDIEIGQVTSTSDKERNNCKILSSHRKELHLPPDMPLASVFVTDYYYPDGRDYPAPHNNIFVKLNAPRLHAHWTSLLWVNQLAMTTVKSVQEMLEDFGVVMGLKDPREEDHVDIRIEALMPRIFIPLLHPCTDGNLPDGIEINISQATVTNCRYGKNSSRNSLLNSLQKIKKSYLFNNSTFPHEKGHDYDVIHPVFEEHATEVDTPLKEAVEQAKMRRISLIGKAYKDVWSVWVRQIWMDFVKKESSSGPKQKSFPFIDSVPLMMWICKTESALQSFVPVPVPPAKTESLPNTPSELNCDVRKTCSEHLITSGDVTGEASNSPMHSKDRLERNKKLLDFYRHSVEKDEEAARKARKSIDGSAAKYIVIDSEKPISLMVDHYQFLFLLRLMESIGHVGEKVLSDTATIFSSIPSLPTLDSSDADSTGVRIFLPLINLFLILRPSTANRSSVSDPANQILPVAIKREIEQILLPRFSSASLTTPSVRSSSPSECSSPDNISVLGDDVTSLSFIPPIGGMPYGVSPGEKGRVPKQEIDKPNASSSPRRSKSGSDPAAQLRAKIGDRLTTVSGGMSLDNVSNKSTALSSGYHTDSIDSLATVTVTSQDDNDSQSSGSLDQYVVLEMDPPPIEEVVVSHKPPKLSSSPRGSPVRGLSHNDEGLRASVVKPRSASDDPPPLLLRQDTGSSLHSAAIQTANKIQVSLLRISADGAVELTIDSYDDDSSIRIVAPLVSAKQLGDMSLDGAVSNFLQSGATPTSNPCMPSSHGPPPSVRMRIDSGRCASRFYEGAGAHMQIEVRNFKETLLSTTLANLGAFMEDEKTPENLPMKIDAYDVTLTIENDEIPVYPNSVQVPPVLLNVHEAHIRRDVTGTFHVSTESVVAPDLLKTLHFSSTQESPSFSFNQDSPCDAQSSTDVKVVSSYDKFEAEVASLRLKLEQVTRERDSLVSALTQLQDELNVSEKERSQVKSLLGKPSNPRDMKMTS